MAKRLWGVGRCHDGIEANISKTKTLLGKEVYQKDTAHAKIQYQDGNDMVFPGFFFHSNRTPLTQRFGEANLTLYAQ